MKLAEIKTVAKSKGINHVGKTKESLIREIQKTERKIGARAKSQRFIRRPGDGRRAHWGRLLEGIR